MTDHRPTLFVLGSSHGKRLAMALQKITELSQEYKIENYAKSGARFENMDFPNLEKLTDRDVIIIQIFGNNFLKKFIKIKFINGKKQMLLTKYVPVPESTIISMYNSLKEIFSCTRAKVFCLDCPVRHLNHSSRQLATRVFQLFKARNKSLHRTLKNSNITTLDHKKFLGVKNTKLRTVTGYAETLVDDVHFFPIFYENIAKKLWCEIKKKEV
jgi:hypothetical protein